MKSIQRKKSNKGFTLIKILGIIAVIGILAGLLIPISQKIIQSGQKSKAAINLRQIALAISHHAVDKGVENQYLEVGTDIKKLAEDLDLQQSDIWVVKNDLAVIASGVKIESKFDPAKPYSFDIVNKVPTHKDPSTTPIAWTRGLNETTGKWDKDNGVFGEKGAFIAFLDGHIVWYETAQFVKDNTETAEITTSYKEAIHPTAAVIKATGFNAPNNN